MTRSSLLRRILLRAFIGVAVGASGARADAGLPPMPPPPAVGPEVAVSSSGYGSTFLQGRPSGDCGPDRCLAVWNTPSSGAAMTVDADGAPRRHAALLLDGSVGTQSAAYVGGDFVAASYSGGDVTLQRLSGDGASLEATTTTVGSAVLDLALAWNGARLLLAFRDRSGTGDELETLAFGADLKPIGAPVVLATETSPYAALATVVTGADFVVLSGSSGFEVGQDAQPSLGPVAMPAAFADGVSAVSANGVPIVLTTGYPTNLYALGSDLKPGAAVPVGVSSMASALGWNGTHLLVFQSDRSGTNGSARRYTPTLTAVDQTATTVRTPMTTVPIVLGRGGEFMLLAWKGEGYVPAEYGFYSQPLNAGGRSRLTAETLVSAAPMTQRFPSVVAEPSGFVVAASQGVFEVALAPLGTDGKPRADRPASAFVTERFPVPMALAASPSGGLVLAGGFSDSRTFAARFGGAGALVDKVPQVLLRSTSTPGGLVWNGTSFLWTTNTDVTVVGADNAFGAPGTIYSPASPTLTTADGMGGTTLAAWVDYYEPPGKSGLQPRAIRLDTQGTAIDTVPQDVGEAFPHPGTGLSLAHDGAFYLAVWDAARVEASGALTSEVRCLRLRDDGRLGDPSSTLLRRATGAVPSGAADPVPALSSPKVVFDGTYYWVVWYEKGVFLLRVGTNGQVVDPAPIQLLANPVDDYAVASRGDGAVLIVYSKLDRAPDVQSTRLEARLMGAGVTSGAPDGGTVVSDSGAAGSAGSSDSGSGGSGGAEGGDGSGAASSGGAGAATGITRGGNGGTSAASAGGTPDIGLDGGAVRGASSSSGGCSCGVTRGDGRDAHLAVLGLLAGIWRLRRILRRPFGRGRA